MSVKTILTPSKVPMYNEPTRIGGTNLYNSVSPTKKTFMEYLKKSPEALGIFGKIVKDINSKVKFRDVLKPNKGGGRPKKQKGESENVAQSLAFAKENFFKMVLAEQLMDVLGTGEGFSWLGKVKQNSPLRGEMKKFGIPEVNFLRYISSTTTDVKFDEVEVTGFEQDVNGKKREWSADEVVHAVFMRIDGKVNGFTPFFANRSIIQTLGLIKDYCGNFFAGGGVPDIAFVLPNEMMNSPSYQKINQTIQDYSDSARSGYQKRGHLTIAGDLRVERLNDFNKDMEFRQLLLTYTGILAFTFQMPASMLKAILGAEVKESSGGTDVSEAGYWRNIQEMQEYMEELYNSKLWRPYFDTEMFFSKRYLIDEIKESQNMVFLADLVVKQNLMLASYDKKVALPTILHQFNLREDDLDELTPEEKAARKLESEGGSGYRQDQPSNQEAQSGPARQQYSDEKKKQAK